jgi:hypothetical protein
VLVAVVDEEKEESSKDISVSNAVVFVSVVVKDKMSFGGGWYVESVEPELSLGCVVEKRDITCAEVAWRWASCRLKMLQASCIECSQHC